MINVCVPQSKTGHRAHMYESLSSMHQISAKIQTNNELLETFAESMVKPKSFWANTGPVSILKR